MSPSHGSRGRDMHSRCTAKGPCLRGRFRDFGTCRIAFAAGFEGAYLTQRGESSYRNISRLRKDIGGADHRRGFTIEFGIPK